MNTTKRFYVPFTALALLAGGMFYFVLGEKKADTVQADGAAITERVAAPAGARVTQTQLR